jgi:hypothetical protein
MFSCQWYIFIISTLFEEPNPQGVFKDFSLFKVFLSALENEFQISNSNSN